MLEPINTRMRRRQGLGESGSLSQETPDQHWRTLVWDRAGVHRTPVTQVEYLKTIR